MLFFTSDTHFDDPRIMRIDRRPFANLQEHSEALIACWNETVGENDDVWHLGDFMRRNASSADPYLARLKGRKHLIIGNNDGPAALHAEGWASRQHYAELTTEGHLLILCHYPFRTWNQIGRKSINLHGHSHGRLKPMTRQYDVGVDACGFRPVSLATLLARRKR